MSEKKYNLEDVKAWAMYEIGIEGWGFIYRENDRERHLGGILGGIDCFYYINGEPSCIVARMLHRHGIIDEDKSAPYEGTAATTLIRGVAMDRFTESALDFIGALQFHQDKGDTWGESYRLASDQTNSE